jgi:heat shock protein HslJ
LLASTSLLACGPTEAQGLRGPRAEPQQPQQTKPSPVPEKMFPYKAVWTLREINGKPVPREIDATLMIDQNNHGTGSGGCNTWSSPMAPIVGQRIAMGAIALTKRSCPPAAMAFERSYLITLHSGPSWDLVSSELVLKTPTTRLVFRRGL